MTALGGSIESITIDGREFPVTADADINRKLGGFENTSEPNGNGSGRLLKMRTLPALTGVVVECDDGRGDHEFLQAVADGNDYVPTFLAYNDGTIYGGVAQIEGELNHSNANATLSFDMKGSGTFEKQQ